MSRLTRHYRSLSAPCLTAVLLLCLGACQTETRESQAPEPSGPQAVEPVEIMESMSVEASTFSEPGAYLFKREQDFESYRRGRLVDLEVDWDDSDVVVLALGSQPTGGYWAKIRSAQRVGPTLYIQAVANRPGPDEMVTQALTFPVAVAVVEKSAAGTVVPEVDSVTGRDLR